MKKLKNNSFLWGITFSISILFVLTSSFDVSSLSAQTLPTTKISHTPINYFVSGHRIRINALVTDEWGIDIVRCYFKAQGEADFVFVDMPQDAGDEYIGILPAPSANTEAIEYLLLAVNQNKVVVKSQVFIAERQEDETPPAWQEVDASGQITVKTELTQVPETIAGFTDNIVADVVESVVRFGYVVEGLYILSQMQGIAPLGAVFGGTVNAATAVVAGTTAVGAGTAAVSTGAAAGGGSVLGTVAIITGAAAVAGGAAYGGYILATGGKVTERSLSGETYSYRGTSSAGSLTGSISFIKGGTHTYVANGSTTPYVTGRSGTGTWSLSGTSLKITDNDEGHMISGTVDGDKKAFTCTGYLVSNNWTFTFTRR